MWLNREELQKMNIKDLRIKAREVGVNAPTRLKKDDLVEAILTIVEKPKAQETAEKRVKPRSPKPATKSLAKAKTEQNEAAAPKRKMPASERQTQGSVQLEAKKPAPRMGFMGPPPQQQVQLTATHGYVPRRYQQRSQPNGHYNHIDTINDVRRLGSIQAFVDSGAVKDGIIYECVKKGVPFVLVGSGRDDGPLPEVYGNVYEGQDAMRNLIRKATTIICMASTLHTVATGNMTPSYRVVDGVVRPVYFYSVDVSEFAVNKLRDRGSLSVRTIVTNVQDFVVNVCKGVL